MDDYTMETAPQQPLQEQTEQAQESVTVVDIRFRNNEKTYFFDPDGMQIPAGSHVIVDTARGDEFGVCAVSNHEVSVSDTVSPLRKVLRLATPHDEKINAENQEKEKTALEICQQRVAEHGLDMQLVSCECAFDGSKILFFFTSDGRVDFRELVKDLASIFRTRIELRQIGVRDKAKMVGGLGICGRPFCCKEFLDDFQSVSIKMAKTQNLSLNPTKISGTCGRLMCCLKYEQEAYEDLLKTAPKNESFVDTPDGRGTIVEVNLLRQNVRVRMEDHPETIGCYANCDICVLRSGKARKNDPPIPKDLAPISSQPRRQMRKPEEQEELLEVIYPDAVMPSSRESFEWPEEEPTVLPEAGEAAAGASGPEQSAGEQREKSASAPRRRRGRRGGRGGSEGREQKREGTADAPVKTEKTETKKPRPQNRRPEDGRSEESRNPEKAGNNKQGQQKRPAAKPHGTPAKQTEKAQERPLSESGEGAAKQNSRRRRYRGHRPAGDRQSPKAE